MKHLLPIVTATFFLTTGLIIVSVLFTNLNAFNGAPPYDASGTDNVSLSEEKALMNNWKRPDGPAKVALQAGHWKTDEVPEELNKLRGNSGASGGGMAEWEVNYKIAELTKSLLEAKGVTVEILPTTITPKYWADVFVSIHADGNPDTTKTGFKAAIPRRDNTGNAQSLLTNIETSYASATGMVIDPNVTRNMRGYYAFSWWRYDHAVHPMTTSIILETGFLSSPSDREIIVTQPELSAEGLANGIIAHLEEQELL